MNINNKARILLLGVAFLAAVPVSQGQILNRIKKKAEKAAEKAIDDVVSGDEEADQAPEEAPSTGLPAKAAVSQVVDFTAGDSLLFGDDLTGETIGSMPHYWKTSGSGQVVTFPGTEGNWMLLKEFTTYKLDTLLAMPADFSLEFDIITRSDKARDLNDFNFGFARDNSVSSYISDAYNDNAITSTTVHYWNEEVIHSSSDTKVYNTSDFELANYANAVMHVSIQVNGTKMKVYLDDKKVLDTDMFDPKTPKYFYMSTGTELNNEAQIAVSNFQLRE